MFRALVLATALALASVGTATAQDAGRSNLESAQAAYDRGEYREAVRLWRMAADQGDASAQRMLGVSYFVGIGVPRNFVEAVGWYRMAADQGDAIAQRNLGRMYSNGLGVPQNDAEAVRWYRMAADQGVAEAQLNLGIMYADGRGIPQNYVEAYKWLALAAAQGDDLAVTNRDLVVRKMTPAQIAEGQRLAAAWRPR